MTRINSVGTVDIVFATVRSLSHRRGLTHSTASPLNIVDRRLHHCHPVSDARWKIAAARVIQSNFLATPALRPSTKPISAIQFAARASDARRLRRWRTAVNSVAARRVLCDSAQATHTAKRHTCIRRINIHGRLKSETSCVLYYKYMICFCAVFIKLYIIVHFSSRVLSLRSLIYAISIYFLMHINARGPPC